MHEKWPFLVFVTPPSRVPLSTLLMIGQFVLSYVTVAASILCLDGRKAPRGLGPECSASYRTSRAGIVPLISTVTLDECGQRGGER